MRFSPFLEEYWWRVDGGPWITIVRKPKIKDLKNSFISKSLNLTFKVILHNILQINTMI